MMDPKKKAFLEASGWKVGTVAEYLGLTPEESALVEMKVRMALLLKQRRQYLGWSQSKLATAVKSSQSRIAQTEALKPSASVSMDLLMRCLFATGITSNELARTLYRSHPYPIGVHNTSKYISSESYSFSDRYEASNFKMADVKDIFEIA